MHISGPVQASFFLDESASILPENIKDAIRAEVLVGVKAKWLLQSPHPPAPLPKFERGIWSGAADGVKACSKKGKSIAPGLPL
jgi:hypothetical protein